MNNDNDPRRAQVPLPAGSAGSAAPAAAPIPVAGWAPLPARDAGASMGRAIQTRTDGLRRVRQLSNWTVAALIVGTGATVVALAHNAVPVTPPAFPGSAASGTATTGTTTGTHGTSGPQVGHAVATTSASGVTTTTTQLPNGKTVVTHSGQSTYHDN